MNNSLFLIYGTFRLSINWWIHTSCIYHLVFINNTTIKYGYCRYLLDHLLLILVYSMPISLIAVLYCYWIFNFLRNCHVIFHSNWNILFSYQQAHKGSNIYPNFFVNGDCTFVSQLPRPKESHRNYINYYIFG